jgi:hypothetical protein
VISMKKLRIAFILAIIVVMTISSSVLAEGKSGIILPGSSFFPAEQATPYDPAGVQINQALQPDAGNSFVEVENQNLAGLQIGEQAGNFRQPGQQIGSSPVPLPYSVDQRTPVSWSVYQAGPRSSDLSIRTPVTYALSHAIGYPDSMLTPAGGDPARYSAYPIGSGYPSPMRR